MQIFLTGAEGDLRRHGMLYPVAGTAGRMFDAQHNIAWELARDRRFSRTHGTIDDLAHEVAAFDGDAIVSSEDFETIVDRPERWAPLRRHPALADREFVVVVYVRRQVAYLESIYREMIRHGAADEFDRFVEVLLHDRRLCVRDWVFQFDYAAIRSAWAARADTTVIMRNYHRLDGGSVLTDFLGLTCPEMVTQAAAAGVEVNVRATLAEQVGEFYRIRVERPVELAETAAIERLCNMIGDRRVTVSERLRGRLSAVFEAANRRMCAAAKLPSEGLVAAAPPAGTAVAMERLFSFEAQTLLADIAAGFCPDTEAEQRFRQLLEPT